MGSQTSDGGPGSPGETDSTVVFLVGFGTGAVVGAAVALAVCMGGDHRDQTAQQGNPSGTVVQVSDAGAPEADAGALVPAPEK